MTLSVSKTPIWLNARTACRSEFVIAVKNRCRGSSEGWTYLPLAIARARLARLFIRAHSFSCDSPRRLGELDAAISALCTRNANHTLVCGNPWLLRSVLEFSNSARRKRGGSTEERAAGTRVLNFESEQFDTEFLDCRLQHYLMSSEAPPVRSFISTWPSIYYRVWPQAALAAGLTATVAWIGLLAYGIFELGETFLF
jgi:hypothetical protein